MSYKLRLAVAVAAACALPTIAVAQDPSTRTDITVVGAVSAEQVEAVADANATPAADLPIVYDDAAEVSEEGDKANAEESAASSAADLSHAVESE
jgi:hypothetical protein